MDTVPRMASRRRLFLIGGCLTALVLAAAATAYLVLGGDDPDAEARAKASRTVSANQWARSVCPAVINWSSSIRGAVGQVQKKVTEDSDPASTKTELVALFGDAESASDTARRKVVQAGIPEVDNGSKVAREFAGALAAARDGFGTAKRTVAGLDTADKSKFYDGVVAAGDRLTKEYKQSSSALKTNSSELDKAFDSVPECH
jgi:hypothetical protein